MSAESVLRTLLHGKLRGLRSEGRIAERISYINAGIAPGISSGYFGYIDSVTEEGIHGWVLDAGNINDSLIVSIFLDKELIGTTLSREPRGDIAAILGLPVNPGWYFNWQDAKLPERIKERDQEEANLTFIIGANGPQLALEVKPKLAELYSWVASSRTIAAMGQQLERSLARNRELEELSEHLRKQLEEKNDLLAICQTDLTSLRQELTVHAAWKAELQKDVQHFEQIIKSV